MVLTSIYLYQIILNDRRLTKKNMAWMFSCLSNMSWSLNGLSHIWCFLVFLSNVGVAFGLSSNVSRCYVFFSKLLAWFVMYSAKTKCFVFCGTANVQYIRWFWHRQQGHLCWRSLFRRCFKSQSRVVLRF